MPVRINGATSGSTTIAAPDTGSDETIVLSTALASKADYPSGGSNGDLLTKSGTTTAWASPPSLAGLVLITSAAFTSASSVNVNSCFTSTYQNYRVIIRHTGGNEDVNLRLRASGTDATTNYSQNVVDGNGGALTSGRATPASMNTGINTNAGVSDVVLSGPNLASPTAMTAFCSSAYNGSFVRLVSGIHSASTAYDGFTLVPGGAGTISGFYRVYGLRD